MYAFISGVSLTATNTNFIPPALNGIIGCQIDRHYPNLCCDGQLTASTNFFFHLKVFFGLFFSNSGGHWTPL